MSERLGKIMSADECRYAIYTENWLGIAVYILWNRSIKIPVYCGTAASPTRIKSHLNKDDLANRPIGKTETNPELRAYCVSQAKGWLGISFKTFDDDGIARSVEREIISKLGIQKYGGILFNQRFSG